MRQAFALLVLVLMTAAPLAIAKGPPSHAPGIEVACSKSPTGGPCKHLRTIPDTTVGAGTTRTWTGNQTATGTVVVQAGGTAIVDAASIDFTSTSSGFIVETGGTLVIQRSLLRDGGGSSYSVVAHPGSTLRINHTEVRGGTGVAVATEQTTFHDNLLTGIPIALRLTDVHVDVHHSTFTANGIAVNQSGGGPTLRENTFDGGSHCVRDWRTNPTIVRNVFRGCHVGIWHEQSESLLADNMMRDDGDEPGVGIAVIDTQSPTIIGNDLSNYGTGILVRNARAFIWNNEIHDNVLDGVRVETNTLAMNITANHIHHNGRHGVWLQDAHDIYVAGNTITDHPGAGIRLDRVADDVLVTGNVLARNTDGIVVASSPGVLVTTNEIAQTNRTALFVDANSHFVTLDANEISDSRQGIVSDAPGARLVDNEVTGAWVGIILRGNGTTSLRDSARDGGDGLVLYDGFGMDIRETRLLRNGGNGFALITGGGHTLTNVNSSRNGGHGFYIAEISSGLTDLLGARAIGNAFGLRNVGGLHVQAVGGWWEDNVHAGVVNMDPDVEIDVRHSWWGSADGPSTPSNPTDGDRAEGLLLLTPWATSPPPPYTPVH